jgi:hypothetical protein
MLLSLCDTFHFLFPSHFLYPVKQEVSEMNGETESGDQQHASNQDGKYELFAQVEEVVQRQIQQLVSHCE